MPLAATTAQFGWPEAVAFIGLIVFVMFLIGAAAAIWLENRKLKVSTADQQAMRQLVSRYEQLAEKTLDAQQRAFADMSELRSRTTTIEQILKSVE